MMDSPDRIHFYSPATMTSLELSVGWEEDAGADNVSVYRWDADDDDDIGFDPRFVVLATRLPSTDDAVSSLADALLAERSATGVSSSSEPIDGFAALRNTGRYIDADIGGEVALYQAVCQVSDAAITFTGIAPVANEDRFIADFAAAVDSVRLVLR